MYYRRARMCVFLRVFCLYCDTSLSLLVSIVKGIRSLPYFQTNSPSYDKNHVTLNGQSAFK